MILGRAARLNRVVGAVDIGAEKYQVARAEQRGIKMEKLNCVAAEAPKCSAGTST